VPWLATYGEAVAGQPLADAGVEAAGDRVLDDPDARAEGAHLDGTFRARRVETRNADVEVSEGRPVGLHGQDRVGVPHQDDDPARAVVAPGDVHDVVVPECQSGQDHGTLGLGHRSLA
jgi:hypothetical protein